MFPQGRKDKNEKLLEAVNCVFERGFGLLVGDCYFWRSGRWCDFPSYL